MQNITTKELEKLNRDSIYDLVFTDIKKYQPDIILSNFSFTNKIYNDLMDLNIPIIYMSHAVPGFFSDLNSAQLLNEFINSGSYKMKVYGVPHISVMIDAVMKVKCSMAYFQINKPKFMEKRINDQGCFA